MAAVKVKGYQLQLQTRVRLVSNINTSISTEASKSIAQRN
jgi:hypothetical protein